MLRFLMVSLPVLAYGQIHHICSSSGPSAPGQINMYFATYHPSSECQDTPGKLHIRDPTGNEKNGDFQDVKAAQNANDGEAISGTDSVKRVQQSLVNTWGLKPPGDIITCYKAATPTKPIKTLPEVVYDTAIAKPEEKTDTCSIGSSKVQSWYRVSISDVPSGKFEMWTTGTDARLKHDHVNDIEMPCEMEDTKRFAFDLSVLSPGKPCKAFAGTIANAEVPKSCTSDNITSGFICPVTCPEDSAGELVCNDGKWENTFKCEAVVCSFPSDSDYRGIAGLVGKGCGLKTASETVCRPQCKNADGSQYALESDSITCGSNGKWTAAGNGCKGSRRLNGLTEPDRFV